MACTCTIFNVLFEDHHVITTVLYALNYFYLFIHVVYMYVHVLIGQSAVILNIDFYVKLHKNQYHA